MVTWESVSLSGEVDFHGLATAHDQIYGWDSTSGRFLVSSDGETWDTRSTVDLHGFAVDPGDADHVIGASPEGLIDSGDGGRTWQAIDSPDVVTLSWGETSGLWGVTADGTTYSGGVDGTDWSETGSLSGPPQALLADDDVLYAAAEEDGVEPTPTTNRLRTPLSTACAFTRVLIAFSAASAAGSQVGPTSAHTHPDLRFHTI